MVSIITQYTMLSHRVVISIFVSKGIGKFYVVVACEVRVWLDVRAGARFTAYTHSEIPRCVVRVVG